MYRYRLLWRGQIAPQQVSFEYDAERRFQCPPQLAEACAEACRVSTQCGRQVMNLPLYQILGWTGDERQLGFRLGWTCYHDYLGLSLCAKEQAPLVLAVAAATEIEGRIVLERRSQAVAQGMGLLHVKPSGHIHPPQTPWQALLAEAWEELALRPEEMQEAHCLGLVQSLTANCYCLIYTATTSLGWDEWSRRRPEDAWEAEEFSGLAIDRESLDEWLSQSEELATGPGLAAVRLYRDFKYPAV
ncbi:MAG: NUDIX hydrolase [Candidatus Eremiobacteraeota bacterium]|nr:NUDIX hydrolase [Candidatus Eremiobacteraeota bacterium]MCW5866863.1 NUDIX hydrolase [Candidatus Eremiobacteraeota bacterium]